MSNSHNNKKKLLKTWCLISGMAFNSKTSDIYALQIMLWNKEHITVKDTYVSTIIRPRTFSSKYTKVLFFMMY